MGQLSKHLVALLKLRLFMKTDFDTFMKAGVVMMLFQIWMIHVYNMVT